jgi:hypothetical protein
VEVVRPGAGPVPSQYEFLGGETGVRRKGVHLGHTSGLIIALRAALDHLPEVFTQKDVRAWVKEKRGKVPNGLYAYIDALIKSGEIEVVSKRTFGADAQPQRYRRKQVVSAATGQELSAAEQAWREFRKTVKVQPDTWEDAA